MRTVFEWFVRIFLFGPLILGGIMFLISMFSETAKTKKKANKENQDRNSMNVFADRLVEKMAEKSGSSWDAMAAQFVKGGQYFYIGKNSVSLTKENKFSPNAYLVTVSYEQDMARVLFLTVHWASGTGGMAGLSGGQGGISSSRAP